LGIAVILDLFSQKGLRLFFEELAEQDLTLSPNAYRIYNLRSDYLKTIDAVILFYKTKILRWLIRFATALFCPRLPAFRTVKI
jgi:hypothetical protein